MLQFRGIPVDGDGEYVYGGVCEVGENVFIIEHEYIATMVDGFNGVQVDKAFQNTRLTDKEDVQIWEGAKAKVFDSADGDHVDTGVITYSKCGEWSLVSKSHAHFIRGFSGTCTVPFLRVVEG